MISNDYLTTSKGKCNRRDTCRYIHDPDKVAVCRKFLKGKCEDPDCLLQHKINSERMPVCWYVKGEGRGGDGA